MLDETLVPRADVLASLAPQKTNVEGGDLKRPERGVGFVAFPNMVNVLAPGGLVHGTAWCRRSRRYEDGTSRSQ